MKNLKDKIKKIYPQIPTYSITDLLSQIERFITQLSELQNFFNFYGTPSNELLKSADPFSYNMIHILLSLKKRIGNLQEFYKWENLIYVIALQNELDDTQVRNHWTAFFLTCDVLQTSIINAFAKRLPNTDRKHNVEDMPNHKIDDELHQLLKQLRAQIDDLKLKTHELFGLVNNAAFSDQQTAVPSVMTSKEEHLFFSMPEEVKVSILTHLDVEDLISAQLASKDLSTTAGTAFAMRFKKNPVQVLAHLNEVTPKEAYDFVEGYQRTSEYKALKSLVEHKMPMSDYEVACYMLTRHDQRLPDIEQLKRISTASHIDEQTRDHLLIFIQNNLQIDIATQFAYSAHSFVKANALFELFLKTFPKRYLNLLPFVYFPNVQLVDADLSHAPLSHTYIFSMDMSKINLAHADLRYANLRSNSLNFANMQQTNLKWSNLSGSSLNFADMRQANLRGANLSGAVLDGTLIDGADFSGVNLAYAQLINLDMRNIDLSQVNVEWSYLNNVRLVPDAALEHVEALEDFFNSFEKNLAEHPLESQIKWRIQMLKDLKRLMHSSAERHETHLLFLKKILAHYPPQTLSSTIFTKKHPFGHLFQHVQLIQAEHRTDKAELPLQEEVISILDEWKLQIEQAPFPDYRITTGDLDKRFGNCFAKVPGLTNVNQICQLSGKHFFLQQLFYLDYKYSKLKPFLVNYSQHERSVGGDYWRYASQIFDGELFNLEQLQKIQPEELDNYLYGEEDFIIKKSGRNLNRVKLGGLFISYTPGGNGYCPTKVEIIDFQNKRLKFGFDIGHYSSINSEIYLPMDLLNLESTRYGYYLYPKDVAATRAALELRASVTHYIFATQKGPVPKLVPITTIEPFPEKEREVTETPKDEAENPLLGKNRYGLYHHKPKKPCLMVSETMLCVLT
ncbi:pentapeptide repeat-containing protein [Fluoribacter gormanii]|uniref:pentapeptide repeat-containing protein n=1 Tax=Fluoribacter gormanii TaxID=464 RepID=UPI002243A668|nr:pentapeptide repeat-containing protein [Fluoribacter gormanii]MCW8470791.1 pentapeptide repeat-containing protein [Fluoribacter gormanii]